MADVSFYCVLCGQSLSIGSENAGELVECYACRRVVPVPGFAPPAGGRWDFLPAFAPEILSVEIKFQCSGCWSKLRVDARMAGRKLHCPHCAKPGRVPTWGNVDSSLPDVFPALSPEEVAFLSGEAATTPSTIAATAPP